MAGGQERLLRRRIKSIQSTQKITRAQELIAASRIVRAQARVHAAQPYSDAISQVVRDLAALGGATSSPLLRPREVRTVGHIVVAADRGLAGAYNSSVLRAAEDALAQDRARGQDYFLVTVGRKAESYFRYREYHVDAAFSGFTDQPRYEHARSIGEAVTSAFLEERVDLVDVIFTRFFSIGLQEVERQVLMPLSPDELAVGAEPGGARAEYEFEPSPEAILELLLPRYVEARIFSALLNGAASEHVSRQRAMKAATDNAGDLITNLSRVMNRARQDAITTEIMEIVGGAEALRSSKALGSDDLLADTIEGRHAQLFENHTSASDR